MTKPIRPHIDLVPAFELLTVSWTSILAHIDLPRSEPCATTFLPNSCDNGINLFHRSNEAHPSIRIQTYPNFLLLSIWSEDHGDVSLLTSAGESIKLPLSTAGDTKSCILLDGSQFVSSEGRWTVEFDNDYSISNSMKPPPLPTTSPVKDGSSTTDGPSPSPDDKVEEVVQPFHGNDSGFFEDVVQEEKAIPTNRSMHTGHTIFGNEHKDGDGLHDKIVKAFEEHQATSKHDQEKINENQEAQGISPETDITSASDELEQDQATDPLTESSSQIHDGNAGQLAAYDNTASSDDPDSEETEEEDADAVSDHEESSSPVKAVPYYRPAGEESQPIPEAGAVDAADAFKRSAGQESQAISSNMFLEHSDQILGQASQAIPQRAACGLYQRVAGQESQLIPTESLSNRYRRQTAPESQDVLHVDPTKTDGPTSTETRQTSSPEKAPNPLKRDLGEESQVLEQHVASGLADVVTQVASSAPEIPGTSSTFVATQRSTTSEFHTPRMSRVSKPLARTGTFQSPRAPKLSKRKQSESVDMEASRPEHKRLRTPLVTKFRRHSNASSETSTTSSYHDATAAPPATSHDEADADTITVNTSGSTKRSQSTQSTRSSKRRRTQTSVIPGSIGFPSNPKVVFSGRCATKSKKIAMDAFGRLGGLVVDKALEADLVCIPGDELKKSPKIILALIHGKHIVTERWITECNRQKLFPDPAKYLPIDLEREQDWQFNLKAAIGRGRAEDGKLRKLIMGYKVYVTSQLHREKLGGIWSDFKAIAEGMGARNVYARLPTNVPRNNQTLVLGDEDDVDAVKVGKLGCRLYKNDLLTMAVLRGKLELDSGEFELEIPIKEEPESQE